MKGKGPLLTLAAVAVLAVGLFTVNSLSGRDDPAQDPAATATTAPAETATDEPAPAAVPFPAAATYIGDIPAATGTITLAVTVDGTAPDGPRAIAYACDGDTVEVWLSGTAADGTLALTGRGDARLAGTHDGGAVTGTLWIGERSWTFTAEAAGPPAGLYVSGGGDTARASWIVDQDGGVTGVLRAPDGTTSPAPTLGPDRTAVVGGATVTAEPVSGADEIP